MRQFQFTDAVRDIILGSPIVVVADLETTGFSSLYDEIIEIGAVLLDVEHGKLIVDENGKPRKFSRFVRPLSHKKLPPKIVELTGITDADIAREGVSRNSAIEGFYHFVADYPIVFHNAIFDWGRFMKRDLERAGRVLKNPVVCSMEFARALYPERATHNLASLCEFFGTPIVGHHRAWVDCKYTASVYMAMRKELVRREAAGETIAVPTVQKVLEADDLRLHRAQRWRKGQYDRIYFEPSVGTAFYDLGTKCWTVKRLRPGVQMDVESIAKAILAKLNARVEELDALYPVA